LDSRLAEAIIGAKYKSAGSRLAQIGLESFLASCKETPRVWVIEEPQIRVGRLSFDKGTFGFVVAMIGAGLVFDGLRHWVLLVALVAFCLANGLLLPFVRLLGQYIRDAGSAIRQEVARCQADSIGKMPSDVVDLVVAGMSAELAPRPLQRLLADAIKFES
jgi:hypothetical protein